MPVALLYLFSEASDLRIGGPPDPETLSTTRACRAKQRPSGAQMDSVDPLGWPTQKGRHPLSPFTCSL
jgi:hypothetical protein